MRVGIVGAGIAGLACAEGLARRGHEVVLFDKGRGPGGRMSTRRIETAQGIAHFDHGAQYFTARDADFQSQVATWISDGVVARWPAAGEDAHVGVPAMNAPIRRMAERHPVHWSSLVTAVVRHGDGWRLVLGGGEFHDVDLAVMAVPAEQAAALLADITPDLASHACAAVSAPCWTVMLAFSQRVPVTPDCLTAKGPIGWAARNNAKPGRTGPESWVVQATPEWSRSHIDGTSDDVADELIDALGRESGTGLPPRIATAAHLWRFARCAEGGSGVILDGERRLGLCGDWLIGPRVESAWLSGARLAERIGAGS
ncbi:MAG: FAD-dependent oxidoreductase [Mycobacterium sp.]|nr:FAD-dependent oxidoreductase [Mycobacterium sp.]